MRMLLILLALLCVIPTADTQLPELQGECILEDLGYEGYDEQSDLDLYLELHTERNPLWLSYAQYPTSKGTFPMSLQEKIVTALHKNPQSTELEVATYLYDKFPGSFTLMEFTAEWGKLKTQGFFIEEKVYSLYYSLDETHKKLKESP